MGGEWGEMNRFNSTFKIKPGAKSMKRGGRLRRSAMRQSRRRLNKVGPRTKNWRAVWRFLKPEFDKRGRTGCEFKFIPHVCWGPLDPAHSKKRNKMKGNDIYMVALACRMIHNFMDYECTHEQMELFVLHAIDLAGGPILPERKR